MLTRCNQIFGMKVCRFQCVEQGQISSLSLIKTFNLFSRSAVACRHEFGPTIRLLIDDGKGAECRLLSPCIQPGEQLLKMDISRHSSRFVDQAKTRTPCQDCHVMPTAMGVASSLLDFDKDTRVASRQKCDLYLLPIGTEAFQ